MLTPDAHSADDSSANVSGHRVPSDVSPPPRLLVSVRSAEEAAHAEAGGAAIIDVKEPTRGALGAASVAQIEEVVAATSLPVSVAMGELVEGASWQTLATALGGVSYAKIGLAGAAGGPRAVTAWHKAWRRWRRALPSTVRPIAVVYADWQRSLAPDPRDVLRRIGDAAEGVLIDTFCKDRTVWDCASRTQLHTWITQARQFGCLVALAGSLRLSDLATLPPGVDIAALRGALCCGGREGPLDPMSVTRAAQQLQENFGQMPASSVD